MEPPTPPVPEMERSYQSQFNLFKDSEKREKKKERGEADTVQGPDTDDMLLPELMLMAVNRDMKEMMKHLFSPEQQNMFLLRYTIREAHGIERKALFSPLYLVYDRMDVLRTKRYLIQQDIAKLLSRRTLMIFDHKPTKVESIN